MILRRSTAAAAIIAAAAVATACASTPEPASPSASPSSVAQDGSGDDATLFTDVPSSRPLHLRFPAAGVDGEIEEYTADDAAADGGINPASLDTISWYSGVPDPLPGTDAKNTVYIFGHTWIEPAVFNGLDEVQPGDIATVDTEQGTLYYAVEETIVMEKDDFSSDPTVSAIVPGRLVLVTCHRPEGWADDAPAPENTAVILHLVGGRTR